MAEDWVMTLPDWDCGELTEFASVDMPTLIDQTDERDLDDETQDKVKGLGSDLSLRRRRRNTYVDLQQIETAREHIQRLPDEGEAIHMVISGRYPLFAIIPAVMELANTTITDLHLVTLSYGKNNAADLLEMVDSGRVANVWLLVSHYFAHANPTLYDPLAEALQAKGHRVLAMRTHAKLILMRLADGRKFTVHASANLRSCKNIEQVCFEHDPDLYDFHHQWIGGIFNNAKQ